MHICVSLIQEKAGLWWRKQKFWDNLQLVAAAIISCYAEKIIFSDHWPITHMPYHDHASYNALKAIDL